MTKEQFKDKLHLASKTAKAKKYGELMDALNLIDEQADTRMGIFWHKEEAERNEAYTLLADFIKEQLADK